jgi:hypothetical protein
LWSSDQISCCADVPGQQLEVYVDGNVVETRAEFAEEGDAQQIFE